MAQFLDLTSRYRPGKVFQVAGVHDRSRTHPTAIARSAWRRQRHLSLPTAVAADSGEVFGFIERHGLHGKGIGYVDVHLLASVALTDSSKLWTRDKRLRAVAQGLALAFEGTGPH